MRKIALLMLIACIAGLTGISSAATLTEHDFKTQAKEDYYINDFNAFSCTEFKANWPPDVNGEYFAIFSLQAKFLPTASGNPVLKVFLNSGKEPVGEFLPNDFNNEVVRIVLPRKRLFVGDNTLKVCGKASPGNSIWVLADSTYGIYSMPHFPQGLGLETRLETHEPRVGVPFEIIAIARNYGSIDAQISLSYHKVNLGDALPEASVLEGETSKKGVVKKCSAYNAEGECISPGELMISYKAIAHKPLQMSMLPAAMVFRNAFNEEETMLSNRPQIVALDSNRVSAQIVLDNDKGVAGEKIPIKIMVNNSGARAKAIVVTLKTGLEATGETSKQIPVLKEAQSQEIAFEAKASQAGNYEIGCTLEYEDSKYECEQASLLVEKPAISGEMLAALLLTLLGVVVFVYFYYFKKEAA